ncbi:MAG: cytochrome c-type biogenesis CcmF C-terminal domain-containing protein, partial [Lautropia sp.]|nr:cytochrome c-type biogenesis CcmF C-terminal domain-containing protein [Lautropia sp.]
FMPWLVGTALMHSLIVTELRGSFRNWTLLLAISAFSLSLVGTFLVRSGVLTSVHAFATDPTRGVFILGFLVVIIGGSLLLYAWKAPQLESASAPAVFSASSRESMMLANNVLLVVACAAIFLGTMYPLVLDTLEMGKISVGPPYFEAVFVPLMAPAVFLMGIGPVARWRKAPVPELARQLKWAFAVSLVVTGATAVFTDRFSAARLAPPAEGGHGVGGALLFALGVFIGAWAIASSLALLLERLRGRERSAAPGDAAAQAGTATPQADGAAGVASGAIRPASDDAASAVAAAGRDAASRTAWQRFRALPASFHGMLLAHIGVGVFVIGVAGVMTLEREADEALAPGNQMELGGYAFTLKGVGDHKGPNYQAVRAAIEVRREGQLIEVLHPEKRVYASTGTTQTEAAIDSGLLGDVYVSMGELLPDGRWTVQVWIKPFVDWIWGGCVLMALGGFVAMADKRYRRARRRKD